MKIFLIIIVVLCCIFLGLIIKNYFDKREKFYTSLLIFLEHILNEISFDNKKLNLIVENMNNKLIYEDFRKFIFLYKKFLNNIIDVNELKKGMQINFNYLSEFEKEKLLDFIYKLGEQTKEEEIKKLNNYIKEVLMYKDESVKKNKRYSNLYLKLFIALGITLLIIFI